MNRLLTITKDSGAGIAMISMILAYFDGTLHFLFALFIGFIFNIFAGLMADKVHFHMWRLCNFKGHKFKDSLLELLLITCVTYLLKLMMDLTPESEKSIYVAQVLMWMALYYYVTNGLKNLIKVYPKSRWIRFVYYVITFQFNEMAPNFVKNAWDKSEKKERLK